VDNLSAAVGFTIAFAWRNSIYNVTREVVERFNESALHVISGVYTAIIITIIGVGIILASSRLLRDKR